MTAAGGLRVTRAGDGDRILVLTLDRPERRNAIDSALLAALHAALDEADEALAADPLAVRGVVLAGAGRRAFSAGMDLVERAGFDDEALLAQHHEIVRLVTRLPAFPCVTIAAVEGFALAGGFELALACDLVVAGRGAVFGLPEVGVGILPGGGGLATVTWAAGPARARDLVLTRRRLAAEEAEAWGLVARVVDDGDALATAIALAETVAAGAPLGIRNAKAAIRGTNESLASLMAGEDPLYEELARSRDRREGFAAFVEKRRPRFEGR